MWSRFNSRVGSIL